MEALQVWQAAHLRLDQFDQWLFANVLTLANLVQIPALAVTLLLARLIAPRLARLVDRRVGQGPPPAPSDWLDRQRLWLVARVVPMITPIVWLIGLWLIAVVARANGWPYDVLRIAANLLMAWVVIRLAADLMPFLAQARILGLIVWAVTALNILHLLDPVVHLLDSVALTTGGTRITVLTLIEGAIALAIFLWLSTLVSELLERRMARIPNLTPTTQVLLGKLFKITLICLSVVVALSTVGIDVSALAIFTGAIGVGIGFGMQKTVSNLFSGIILLLDRSIKPGDVIEIGGTYGWVSWMGARYVSVETRNGTEFLIPNEDIVTHQVINWSHRNPYVRLKVQVQVEYDCDLPKALELLNEAAAKPRRVLADPAPNGLILEFGDYAVQLEVRFWIADARAGVHNVKSEVMLEIWRSFRAHGITIPIPKRELHLAGGAATAASAAAARRRAVPGE